MKSGKCRFCACRLSFGRQTPAVLSDEMAYPAGAGSAPAQMGSFPSPTRSLRYIAARLGRLDAGPA
jgi:hypothetical protein